MLVNRDDLHDFNGRNTDYTPSHPITASMPALGTPGTSRSKPRLASIPNTCGHGNKVDCLYQFTDNSIKFKTVDSRRLR